MNKVERIKKLKSGIKFYKNSFGIHPPYLILCESNFLFAAIDSNINIEESFKEIFRGQIYLKISECSLFELNGMKGNQFKSTKTFAHSKCQKFKCGHPPKNPRSCILQALRQGFNGSVATQDPELRRKIHRDFPKNPVFFIAKQTLQISPPPKSLKQKVQRELVEKYAPQSLQRLNAGPQQDNVSKIDDDQNLNAEEEEEEAIEQNNIDTELNDMQNAEDHEKEGPQQTPEDFKDETPEQHLEKVEDNINHPQEANMDDINPISDEAPKKRRRKHHHHHESTDNN